jgi:hypothetical protein
MAVYKIETLISARQQEQGFSGRTRVRETIATATGHQQIGQNILGIFRALPEPKTFSVRYNALQAFMRQRKGL